jgi:hypothetical protein
MPSFTCLNRVGVSRLREAACWAHLRRDFHDFWTSTKSGIACEALDQIGKLWACHAFVPPQLLV